MNRAFPFILAIIFCFMAFTAMAQTSTYTGTGNWSDAGNWDNGVPASTDNAIISSGSVTVDATYTCADLTINSGAVVTIDPGNALTVTGTLTNNAGVSGLVLASDATGTGMLMNNTTGVEATVYQYIVKDQWHYIGIPVSYVEDAQDIFPNCYLAYCIESEASNGSENGWYYISPTDSLLQMQGYAVQYNLDSSDNDTTVTFTGTLNTGLVDTVFASEFFGWNFVSNPYPTTMDWEASGGMTRTNTNDAFYIWDPDLNSGDGGYASWVNGSGTNGGTQYIAPNQGFFVQVTNVNSALSFNDNIKVVNTSTVFQKTRETTPEIRLSVSDGNNSSDEMLLRVKSQSTNGFDKQFDAGKMRTGISKHSLLYSEVDGVEYSINSLPEISEDLSIPLKVLVNTSGEQKLMLKELKSYDYSYPIVLFDEKGNEIASLQDEAYSFIGKKGETKTFYLRFSH